jgi:hypothetical protein
MADLRQIANTVLRASICGITGVFRQVQGESAAFSELGFNRHLAAVQEREMLDDSESEAGAAEFARARAALRTLLSWY